MASGEQVNFEQVEKVLIIKPSSMGDIIHTLPCLAALRQRLPKAHISWLVSEDFLPVLEHDPRIDELIIFPRNKWKTVGKAIASAPQVMSYLQELAERKFDLCLDFQGLLRSGVMAHHSKARWIVGFAKGRELSPVFYTTRVHLSRPVMHAVDRYKELCEGIDLAVDPFDSDIYCGDAVKASVADLLQQSNLSDQPFAILSPVTRWQSKDWPSEYFVSLAKRLRDELDLQVIVTGGPADKAVCESIAQEAGAKVHSFAGLTTVMELIELIRGASLFVGGDSGPTHIAAALGIPIVGMWGATDPEKCGPYGQIKNALQADVDCIQCYRKTCPKQGDEFMQCMKLLSPETVFELCQELK